MDTRLRRSLRTHPDVESRARALAARLRSGTLTLERLHLAAVLDWAPAKLVVGAPAPASWTVAVESFAGACPWACLGMVRLLTPALGDSRGRAELLLGRLAEELASERREQAQQTAWELRGLRATPVPRHARARHQLAYALRIHAPAALGFYPNHGVVSTLGYVTEVLTAWTQALPRDAWTARAAWEQAHLDGDFTNGSVPSWVTAAGKLAVVDWLLDPTCQAAGGEVIATSIASPRDRVPVAGWCFEGW